MSTRVPRIFNFNTLAMVAVAAMVVFGSPGTVHADTVPNSANKVLKLLDTSGGISSGQDVKELLTTSIGQMGKGITWANNVMKIETGRGLYCPPENLAITNEQYVSILRKFVEREPIFGKEIPIQGALIYALKDAFPCE